MTSVLIEKDYGKKVIFSTLIVDMISEEMKATKGSLKKLREKLMAMSVDELSRIYNTYNNYGVTTSVLM